MLLNIEAHPNARVERLELLDDALHVWVRARAVEGQANAAIERLIAQTLGLRPRQVCIVRGVTSRHKIVELAIAGLDELRQRLG